MQRSFVSKEAWLPQSGCGEGVEGFRGVLTLHSEKKWSKIEARNPYTGKIRCMYVNAGILGHHSPPQTKI